MKLILLILCSLASLSYGQEDYKQFLNNKGELHPVYVDAAIRDLYSGKLDKTSASTTYITKSSATATYVKKTDISSVYIKTYSGTTNAAEGGYTTIAHGLDATKIVCASGVVFQGATTIFTNSYTFAAECQFDIEIGITNLFVENHPTNSGSILNKPVKITVFYTE